MRSQRTVLPFHQPQHIGAGFRTRTGMAFRPADFKSAAATITPILKMVGTEGVAPPMFHSNGFTDRRYSADSILVPILLAHDLFTWVAPLPHTS